MGKMVDITGQRYGLLTALYRSDKKTKGGTYYWHFKCDCGNECVKNLNHVRSGLTKSCGCLQSKHNGTGTRLFRIWCLMRSRCRKSYYKYWCGKGIKVCEEWNDYLCFRDWALANGYRDDLTIDRVDSDKDYCPENCRWATYKEQAHNISSNHYITMNGETHLVDEWCSILKIVSASSVYRRVREYGWDFEKALTTPSLKYSDYSNKKMMETKRKEARPFVAVNDTEVLNFTLQRDAEKYGFNRKGIGLALHGKAKCKYNRRFYKGYEWYYLDEYKKLGEADGNT